MKKQYLDYAGLKRVLKRLLPGARKIWHGTLAAWTALSETERNKYDQAEVIDDGVVLTKLTLLGAVQGFLVTPTNPHWLLADGSTVDATLHPRLAEVMPVLPDLRECVLVGTGQNTHNTIAAHDEYTVGEFKDDQLQGHDHYLYSGGNNRYAGWWNNGGVGDSRSQFQFAGTSPSNVYTKEYKADGTNGTPRTGTTTHGKQVGVMFYVWAD